MRLISGQRTSFLQKSRPSYGPQTSHYATQAAGFRLCCRSGLQPSRDRFSAVNQLQLSRSRARHGVQCLAKPSSADPHVLFSMSSQHNDVLVVEFPPEFAGGAPLAGSRALILDPSNSIHSLYKPDSPLLGESLYWEQLALIAEVAPEGPIGILGLGTGSVARIIHHFWPNRIMHGWELDDTVLHAGRSFMGLSAIEETGALHSHTGDALMPDASISGGFAGLIVDLFGSGDVIEPLKQAETWQKIRRKLKPGGRCIANLGKSDMPVQHMRDSFADQGVFVKTTESNLLGLSGKDPAEKLQKLPEELRHIGEGWELLPSRQNSPG